MRGAYDGAMPSDATAETLATPPATPAGPRAQPAFVLVPSERAAQARLAAANGALWAVTVSLMAAFPQVDPAQRHPLARRIARNLEILCGQEGFDDGRRALLAHLAGRWQARAEEFAAA